MPSKASRLAHLALATVIAISGAAVSTAVTAPDAYAVSAASSVGGEISRSEVIARAKYWLSKADEIEYSQHASYPDQDGRLYRTDCSGYVSMAWHMSVSANTGTLANYSHVISRSSLKPGDILNNSADGHVILFEKWDNADHTKFTYLSFGSTPVKRITGASINAATFDSHKGSNYTALRYDKIVDGAPGHDFTGDGRDDLLGITDTGDLRLYRTNSDLSFSSSRVGGGWGTKDLAAATDFNGDGNADIIAADRVTGDLGLWTGKGDGGFNSYRKIGHGWSNMAQLAAGDFNGDGKGDVIAVTKTTADLVLYTSNGTSLNGPKTLGTSGWGNMKNLAAGDFTGDGRADVVATNKTNGALVLYPSNGSGLNSSRVIGSSFHLMDKLTMADLNKDGTSDIVATRASTGDLLIYASNGSKISDTKTIGHGWSTISNLF
jgi:hypothetical protein